MITFNKEYFGNNYYFFLKESEEKIVVYYSVAETLTESRKKDKKMYFNKKDGQKIKKIVHDFLNSKDKPSLKRVEDKLKSVNKKSEIDELVDGDGTLLSSRVPFINHYLSPRKTMDQTVAMSRVTNDPITRGYRVYWGESEDENYNILHENKLSTMEKLILQAKKDGYITGDYSQNILYSAKKVAKEYDILTHEEKKIFRDVLYKKFLKLIGTSNLNEVDFSDAFGYEETEDMDFKNSVKTLKKMGVDNAVERTKQFGKIKGVKPKKNRKGQTILKQRLSEKESIEEQQKQKMIKMVEDMLTKKSKSDSDVVNKEKPISKILIKNLESIKKIADKEGISINKLINILKKSE